MQKAACHIFTCEDQQSVYGTAKQEASFAHKAAQRLQKCGHAVDGEHPDGSCAGKFVISSAECVEGGKGNLQKPAKQPTMNIIVNKFSHTHSIYR